jgi:hypothetical protein
MVYLSANLAPLPSQHGVLQRLCVCESQFLAINQLPFPITVESSKLEASHSMQVSMQVVVWARVQEDWAAERNLQAGGLGIAISGSSLLASAFLVVLQCAIDTENWKRKHCLSLSSSQSLNCIELHWSTDPCTAFCKLIHDQCFFICLA